MGLLSTIGAASGRAFGFTRSAIAQAVDAYFNRVTLLLPGDGTNGAQNNTFLDSSSNNFTITRNGNTTQGTFSPFSQTGWSVYFDGVDSKITIPDTASLEPGTGDFCFETWVWFTANSNGSKWDYLTNQTGGGLTVMRKFDNKLYVEADGVGAVTNSVSTVPINQWVHIAVTRSGTTVRIFFNGTQDVSATSSQNFAGTSSISYGNYVSAYSGTVPVYMSNIRFVKGSAVYTSAFTPSTTPLAAITNTQLLTCQSNRFLDNSSNAFAITVNGTPSVQAFSPFTPTAAYSAATNGGSGYFDGTGDYLTWTGTAAGSGAFSYEFWVYSTNGFATSRSPLGVIATSGYNSALEVRMSGTTINASQYNVANNNFTVPALQANCWNHVVVCRNSSNQMTVFLNGTRSSTGAVTISTNFSGLTSAIGRLDPSNGGDVTGYIAGVRLVTGSTVYDPTQTSITVPTAPPTSASGTQILCNFTNAGITDATAKNVLETVGNAQISTSVSKWGGGSISIPTSSGLFSASKPIYAMPGDYTIEFWVYHTSSVSSQQHYITLDATGSFFCGVNTTGVFMGRRGTAIDIQSSTVPTANTWTHIAFTRSGTTTRIYVNGTSVASASLSTSYAAANLLVSNDSGYFLVGNMDDVRITNGFARYTGASLTVPTSAFPLQ